MKKNLRKNTIALPSQEYLKSRLDYDPDTGIFTWRAKPEIRSCDAAWNKRFAGKPAGSTNHLGYVGINIDYTLYSAHRLAYAYVHGAYDGEIDHANTISSDNRIQNLRLANPSQQNANRKSWAKSGARGVSWHKRVKKWQSEVKMYGQRKHLGYYDELDDAAAAYQSAAKEMHKEFARLQ